MNLQPTWCCCRRGFHSSASGFSHLKDCWPWKPSGSHALGSWWKKTLLSPSAHTHTHTHETSIISVLLAGLCHICNGKRKKKTKLHFCPLVAPWKLTLLEHLLFIFVIGAAWYFCIQQVLFSATSFWVSVAVTHFAFALSVHHCWSHLHY